MIKILVVDDESSIRTAVAYALRREGYEVEMAADGQEALDKVETFRPAVMVLDVMMPRVSGYDVCRKLDGRPRPAILLLTVKDDIVDKVLGLELGADDYMTKPFDMRELLARVKALSRRGGYEQQIKQEQQDMLRLGELSAELFSRAVSIRGELLDLTPKEFDLLVLLMRNPGRVYSREVLLEQSFTRQAEAANLHVREEYLSGSRNPPDQFMKQTGQRLAVDLGAQSGKVA
ncbi:response regulator transcription factor [Paenibacillus elgii]